MALSPQTLASRIGRILGPSARLAAMQAAAGGSINDSFILTLDDGRRLFAKTHRGATVAGMYPAEARALALLAAPGHLAVPRPIHADDTILLLEAFSAGPPGPDWQEKLGRGLALLHRDTRQAGFGFADDNFIGTTPQPNGWETQWHVFWRDRRLGFQLDRFAQQAGDGDELVRAGRRLQENLDGLIGHIDEPAVLLHGDLWSGNAGATERGEPVIFDPASYYGHREAEIGMMRLFGGFGPRCEAAYREIWPLQPGSAQRIILYRLYHELNHLNLFGSGYYAQALASIRSLL